ncbi:hypothetical protein A1OQ_00890 [Enterovibrio norvegicus FF-162]|uniref:DUF1565 domain-containing protein n=1 Tax=Enterovibrio norvegicus TaxID=188144 RepID=UPI0002D6F7FE|nr:DUF1565 domain-containing protein [Enterovibrio norvegicus]OEE77633.1 hypothetical protein A1OQ_00890 [Enterovibrio norvegicus FF-162]
MKLMNVIVIFSFLVPITAIGGNIFVGKSGSDFYDGTTRNTPFLTINKALEAAYPGDSIYLSPGVYHENIVTVRDGLLESPISIKGLRNESDYLDLDNQTKNVLLRPTIKPPKKNNGRLIQIRHSYITLQDVVVDGLFDGGDSPESYTDKLLFVHNTDRLDGLTGVHIRRVTFRNAGGECIRFRYKIVRSSIKDSFISNCGVHAFVYKLGGKNGEGIYVGTSIKQWEDGKNPASDPDTTSKNIFSRNVINTLGNECIEFKEGAFNNWAVDNTCMGQMDGNSGGLASRGNSNYFYGNRIVAPAGSGLYFSSDSPSYGMNNVAKRNIIVAAGRYGIDDRGDDGAMCENSSSYSRSGESSSGRSINEQCN